MSDFIPDSPYLAQSWCPGCQPDRDPTVEILDVRWCDSHRQSDAGDEDVLGGGFLSGSAEAGGEGNRRVCDFIHRQALPSSQPADG